MITELDTGSGAGANGERPVYTCPACGVAYDAAPVDAVVAAIVRAETGAAWHRRIGAHELALAAEQDAVALALRGVQ